MENVIQNIPKLSIFLDECKTVQQNPEFHGEGTVYIHTEMVYNEYLKIKDKLSLEEQYIVEKAVLLHDTGKIRSTKIEDGKIVANGHAKVSYHIALELLDDLDLSFYVKKEIAMLVLYHGKLMWLNEKSEADQIREIIRLSQDCNLKLLYYLILCDIKGRICSDIEKNDKIENLEYFAMLAEDLNCFGKPFIFHNNISKYNYIVKQNHHYTDICFDDTKSKVYMLSGLPGVGKDYYIKHHLNNMPIISLDDIRKELKIKFDDEQGLVIQTAKERAKEYLRKGTNFILNATNTTKMVRDSWIDIFNIYNAYITIIYLHKNMKTIIKQNYEREAMLPEKVINKLFRNIEMPLNSEVHDVKYVF